MAQVLIVRPVSKEVHWIFSLRIAERKNRINSCMSKIERLFNKAQRGEVQAILEVFSWYRDIRQMEVYFDKEIARLTGLIRKKIKDELYYEPHHHQAYRLRINTPISSSFYRIINKFDTLMCLTETCLTSMISKNRRIHTQKTRQYKKMIMRLIAKVSQYKIVQQNMDLPLTDEDKKILATALHSESMPVLNDRLFNHLQSLIQKQ